MTVTLSSKPPLRYMTRKESAELGLVKLKDMIECYIGDKNFIVTVIYKKGTPKLVGFLLKNRFSTVKIIPYRSILLSICFPQDRYELRYCRPLFHRKWRKLLQEIPISTPSSSNSYS